MFLFFHLEEVRITAPALLQGQETLDTWNSDSYFFRWASLFGLWTIQTNSRYPINFFNLEFILLRLLKVTALNLLRNEIKYAEYS